MTVRSIASSISALLLAASVTLLPGETAAESVKADVNVTTADGYARMVFRFTEDTEADVRLSGAILVVAFKKEVEFNTERLTAAREYISAVRRDPDGKGLRVALARKVRLSSKVAGERLFVDLLPDSWTAAAPPLPQEVIDELIRRTREAEKRVKQQQAVEKQRPKIMSKVRVSRQPTFIRYIFELPDLVPVTPERNNENLILKFGVPLKFDLVDARTIRSPAVESVEAEETETSATVTLSLLGNGEVRTFREDTNYVVDVLTGGPPPPSALEKISPEAGQLAAASAPQAAAASDPSPETQPAKPPAAAGDAAAVSAGEESNPPEADTSEGKPPEAKPMEAQPAPAQRADASAGPQPQQAPDELPRLPGAAPAIPRAIPDAEGSSRAAGDVAAAPAATNVPPAGSAISVTQKRQSDTVSLVFPFAEPVPIAVFMRAESLFILLDATKPIDLAAIKSDAIRDVMVTPESDFQYVRVKLDRPRLISVGLEDANWTVNIGDTIVSPGQPLAVLRSFSVNLKATALVPLDRVGKVHRLKDPDIGDELVAVTALGPVRGLPKAQDFVDFRALASVHGVVIQPLADDIGVDVSSAGVTIGRPSGLIVTSSSPSGSRGGQLRTSMFDTQQWGFDRQAEFLSRQLQLVNAAAQAPEVKRTGARLDLARFYFAREMYAEAKGVLDVILADDRPTAEDTTALVMRGVAQILIGRADEGLKDLNQPIVGIQNDAGLWRALASARQGKWPAARDGLSKADAVIVKLPIELQREILKDAIRASIEVGDFAAAEIPLNDLETLGIPISMKPGFAVLAGRVHEGLGHTPDALASYRMAADSNDRAAAAQGRLRELALHYKLGDIKSANIVSDLEALTTAWRGDETEADALQMVSRLYTEESRYRDAFDVMRVAIKAHPNSEVTRRIQDEAMRTFDALFLGGKGDALPPIDALSMFYDFKDLTPIGRRGDEMIRRLADRLLTVDLLDQAAELLQHQVDHRLQGAARAQVAARLAVIYLMNRKPDRAIQALRATRTSELSNEVRSQRLMIEARALADVGRHNLAIEVIANIPGPDAIRLRSEILWSAGNYGASAEQTELIYADRWRDWSPLNEVERREILRAAVGYSLAEDKLGLERFREKFAPSMLQSADRQNFQVVTAPIDPTRPEFKQIVQAIATIDTLEQFVRDMRAKQPEILDSAPASSPLPPSLSRLLRPDRSATGSIARARAR